MRPTSDALGAPLTDGWPGLDLATAPSDNSYRGTDVNVILVINFGFTTGFMQGVLGNSIHMVANTHMAVGGY